MKKKNYLKPFMAFETFVPQQFVAACSIDPGITPTPVSAQYYKIDGLSQGKYHSNSANGYYDSTGEQCTTMQQLDATWIDRFFVQGPSKGYKYHIDRGYLNLSGTLPSSVKTTATTFSNTSYWTEVAIMHQELGGSSSGSFFLLANEWKGDDISAYLNSYRNNS